MVKELLNYREEDLLFVDIETASNKGDISLDSKELSLFQWKMREKDTDNLLPLMEVKRLYKQKAALFPIYGQIICITLGVIRNEKATLITYSGKEKEILQRFVHTVNKSNKVLVFWNADFDLPYIRKRFVINGLQDYLNDTVGNDAMKKPWTLRGVLDLMQVWKGINWGNDGLNEVAWSLGLPLPKEDLQGSEVSDAFHSGRITDIIKYCEEDVKALINIYRVFTYQSVITDMIIKTESNSEIKDIPLINEIYERGRILKKNEKPLITLFSSFTESEKKEGIKILKSCIKGGKLEQRLIDKLL